MGENGPNGWRKRLAKALADVQSAHHLVEPLLSSRAPRVASFFAGAGGLDIGFHKACFEIVFATDVEPLFCETLKANRGRYLGASATVLCEDIRRIRVQDLSKDIDFIIEDVRPNRSIDLTSGEAVASC